MSNILPHAIDFQYNSHIHHKREHERDRDKGQCVMNCELRVANVWVPDSTEEDDFDTHFILAKMATDVQCWPGIVINQE